MSTDATYQEIPLKDVHESPLNPRKTFDPVKLASLIASVKVKGVITPLIVRPNAKGYEIAAGHRRYRAAKAADLAVVPAVVRKMDDETFLETLVFENDEREDLHPLEEAEGYRTLMTKSAFSAARIAERTGYSEKYVYDRIKLLSLIPEAQKLFRERKFDIGHAILLARLSPEDQKRIVTVEKGDHYYTRSVLLKRDAVLFADDQNKQPKEEPVKAISVRELERWIAEHVRFKATEADPVLFPETTAAVTTAISSKEKVVEITHLSYIQEEAREGKTIRTGFWERADGKQGSKTCDRSVVGVIVVGPEQGQSYRVCVDRERCTVHWAKEIKEREKRAAAPKPKAAAQKPAVNSYEIEQKRREAAERRCSAALPAIFEALAAKVMKAPAGAKGALGKLLLEGLDGEAGEYLTAPSSAEDLVRFLAFDRLSDHADTWNGLQNLTRALKPFGVDVKKHLAEADKEAKADAKAEKPKGKKK